uniref:HDC11876 n=1 Tax=Drosophila melanogaster TaxID=7227 RepID=Q6IKP8_DROME|nr:TPA_inf: HDC11876 [Drosophila melanogaster]
MMNAVRFFLVLFLVLALLATGYLIDIDDAAPNGIIPKPGHLSSEVSRMTSFSICVQPVLPF